MTVNDLIDYLQQFPPESKIVLTEDQAGDNDVVLSWALRTLEVEE